MEPAEDLGAEPAARRSLVDGAEAALRAWLAPGRFREGDRLPPEQDLAGMLGISRGTLRTALRRLEGSGEIVRRQGSGTFVAHRLGAPTGSVGMLRVDSFTTRGFTALVIGELEIAQEPIGTAAAAALGLASDRRSTCVRRRLARDRTPAVLAHDVFHPDLVLPPPEVVRAALEREREVYDLLAASGVEVTFVRSRITSRTLAADEPLATRLQTSSAIGCLVVEEIVLGTGGEPVVYSWDLIAPGMVEIEVTRAGRVALPDAEVVHARDEP